MKDKHSPPHPDTKFQAPPPAGEHITDALSVSEADVVKAIKSFPNDSAGGPDGLRPQHLKDMISTIAGPEGENLLSSLTSLANLALSGDIPSSVRPIFFGASLTILNKKGGGVRTIAIGCTLRRLVAKLASHSVVESVGTYISPFQLGSGVPFGAEAAAHSARSYLNDLPSSHILLKLDFENAFNTIRRDKVLEAVAAITPQLLPYVFSCYSSPSTLYLQNTTTLESREGIQQGDPLGPLLFCLSIQPVILQLSSEFRVFYLDDGTLGGLEKDVLHDFFSIKQECSSLGLKLNISKSELISYGPAGAQLLKVAPNLRQIHPNEATLLGSPIGQLPSINTALSNKIQALRTMGSRLSLLSKHDALLLLGHCFALPKILYVLRTAPCFLSPILTSFDQELRSSLSLILNINFDSDPIWSQASLPVSFGGIGVHSAIQLAPSAYLASAAGSTTLLKQILSCRFHNNLFPAVTDAIETWKAGHNCPPPSSPADCHQKAWDIPRVQSTFEAILSNALDPRSRARLLATSTKESGAWLNTLPVSSLGLRLDDNSIRIAVGLRLGAPLCRVHTCQLCGGEVDELALHGLSCNRSAGRHPRHSAINDILKRGLAPAGIPSILEPPGLSRCDEKDQTVLL